MAAVRHRTPAPRIASYRIALNCIAHRKQNPLGLKYGWRPNTGRKHQSTGVHTPGIAPLTHASMSLSRVYDHTTTAMHDMSTPPQPRLSAPLPLSDAQHHCLVSPCFPSHPTPTPARSLGSLALSLFLFLFSVSHAGQLGACGRRSKLLATAGKANDLQHAGHPGQEEKKEQGDHRLWHPGRPRRRPRRSR